MTLTKPCCVESLILWGFDISVSTNCNKYPAVSFINPTLTSMRKSMCELVPLFTITPCATGYHLHAESFMSIVQVCECVKSTYLQALTTIGACEHCVQLKKVLKACAPMRCNPFLGLFERLFPFWNRSMHEQWTHLEHLCVVGRKSCKSQQDI